MKREKSKIYPVKMDVYYKDKHLGTTWVVQASSHDDRWASAVLANLSPFDKLILDDGRVECWMVPEDMYDKDSGFTTVAWGMVEYWNYKTDQENEK